MDVYAIFYLHIDGDGDNVINIYTNSVAGWHFRIYYIFYYDQ